MAANIQYDTTCLEHPQKTIVFICSTCSDNIPECSKCIISSHNGHVFKDLEDININFKKQINKDFITQTLPQLSKLLENNNSQLEKSDNQLKQIQENHTKNLETLTNEFNKIKDIVNIKENDFKKLLITKLDENIEANNIFISAIEDSNEKVNNILNTQNNNKNKNQNNNQFIEIVKRSHICKKLLSNFNNYPQYNEVSLLTNESNFELVKKNIDGFLSLVQNQNNANGSNSLDQHQKYMVSYSNTLKIYKDRGLRFFVYKNGCSIENSTKLIAIYPGSHLPPVFPPNVTEILLPDGFNQSLDSLPPSVKVLYLFNISYQLKNNSIPHTVESIYFGDGFSQGLGWIDKSFYNFRPPYKKIFLGNIAYPYYDENYQYSLIIHYDLNYSFEKYTGWTLCNIIGKYSFN
ncbi:hypothetical protein DICPUDRAFT_155845 [Dictyostelium purpureum]|uniref:B box-type domain-containing protein n=1 Tax=Dictyostelium purpureum TaxID=5786 RepID=F0ZV13_DICPU|nr:uncharacterized protein DICPUDRAFT_155845 [Dictyostelium purpureum]EGC32226.1 hypothetical protein DICPUDRAFT_155845 [Dictyostelium purpureum]|eukprot:XP_003291262.1 hypothetical protein DICPUDRAFT_155845 [Dictyostelium purpureum]